MRRNRRGSRRRASLDRARNYKGPSIAGAGRTFYWGTHGTHKGPQPQALEKVTEVQEGTGFPLRAIRPWVLSGCERSLRRLFGDIADLNKVTAKNLLTGEFEEPGIVRTFLVLAGFGCQTASGLNPDWFSVHQRGMRHHRPYVQ